MPVLNKIIKRTIQRFFMKLSNFFLNIYIFFLFIHTIENVLILEDGLIIQSGRKPVGPVVNMFLFSYIHT